MNFLKNNWFKIGILIFLGFVAYTFYFRYTVDIPSRYSKPIPITAVSSSTQEQALQLEQEKFNYQKEQDLQAAEDKRNKECSNQYNSNMDLFVQRFNSCATDECRQNVSNDTNWGTQGIKNLYNNCLNNPALLK